MKNQILFLLFVLTLCAGSLVGQETKLPSEIKGTIIDVAGAIPGGGMVSLNVKIEKYTSDEDAQKFGTLLAEKGPEALAKTIHDLKNGSISVGSSFPYHLSITRTFEKDGKRIVRALTDRPISMFGTVTNSRNMDYPFSFIEFVLEADGKGKGTLVAAAKIRIKNGSLEMETYGLEPFQITKVTAK